MICYVTLHTNYTTYLPVPIEWNTLLKIKRHISYSFKQPTMSNFKRISRIADFCALSVSILTANLLDIHFKVALLSKQTPTSQH